MKNLLKFSLLVLISIGTLLAEDELEIHGYLTQTALKTTKNNEYVNDSKKGSSKWTEFGLNFFKSYEDFDISAQLVSRNVGSSDPKVFLDWGYGSYTFNELFGIRLGKVRLPLGTYNEFRDVDLARTAVMTPQSSYSESFRDLFTAVQGGSIFGQHGPLRYLLTYGSMAIPDDFRFNTDLKNSPSFLASSVQSNVDFVVSSLVNYETPIEGLELSCNYFRLRGHSRLNQAHPPALLGGVVDLEGRLEVDIYAVGSQYSRKDWTFTAEHMWQKNDFDWTGTGGALANTFAGGLNGAGAGNNLRKRWYLSVNRQISEKLSAEFTYDYSNTDRTKKHLDVNYRRTQTLAIRYDLKETFVLKLQADRNTGYSNTLELSNSLLTGATPSRNWNSFLVRAIFTF